MAHAIEIPQKSAPRPQLGGCGGCTYAFNSQDGCYHRQSNGCAGGCTCPPLICGLGSLMIQGLRPGTAQAAVPVALVCSAQPDADEWSARAILELVAEESSSATFWKRTSIGLGVLSGLLAIGLVVALVYR